MLSLYRLHSSHLDLAFSAEAGGCPAWLLFDNGTDWVDLFRPASEESLEARDPQGMGCFVSMPYVSRISNGTFVYENRTYHIPPNQPPSIHPLHGMIWRRPATIEERGDTTLVIRHQIDEPDYPFHFSSEQVWTLDGNKILLKLSQTNTGTEALPFGMGLHPFFNKTPRCRIKTGVDKIITNDADVIPVSLDPLPSQYDFTRTFIPLNGLPIDNCFTGWNRVCDIEWPDLSAALTMTADDRFNFFVICSPETTDWFCANPVSHFNDAFNNSIGLKETGLTVLQPGTSMSGTVEFILRRL